MVEKETGHRPATPFDQRRIFDDKSIDAVTLATPNHWHALETIWACQAGKDVYVEKPASHNIFEGRKAVEAARNTAASSSAARNADHYYVFLGRGRKPGPQGNVPGNPMMDTDHFRNWVSAMRSRKPSDLYAEIEEGHLSAGCRTWPTSPIAPAGRSTSTPRRSAPWATPRPRSC